MELFGSSLSRKDDEATRRTLARDLRQMAAELAGPNSSPAVHMLAETVALCWAELRRAEVTYIGGGDRTIAQADHQQRRIDRCHSRFMRTLRTLAQVRRLQRDAPAFSSTSCRRSTSAARHPHCRKGGREVRPGRRSKFKRAVGPHRREWTHFPVARPKALKKTPVVLSQDEIA